MQLVMCINVLRGRLRPFKFGWVWNTFCYANISVLLPRLLITWPHVMWRSHWGVKGAECHPWQRKKCQQSEKTRKNQEKSGRKGKTREESFNLPLLTDRAGYATAHVGCMYVDALSSHQKGTHGLWSIETVNS